METEKYDGSHRRPVRLYGRNGPSEYARIRKEMQLRLYAT